MKIQAQRETFAIRLAGGPPPSSEHYHVSRPGHPLGQEAPVFLWSDKDAAHEYSQGEFPVHRVDTSGLDLHPDEEYDPGVAFYSDDPIEEHRFQPLDDEGGFF